MTWTEASSFRAQRFSLIAQRVSLMFHHVVESERHNKHLSYLGVSMDVRLVTKQDESLLLRWRNDSHVRAVSGSTQPITSREHHSWFGKLLVSDGTFCFIGTRKSLSHDEPVGYCRFDKRSTHLFEISIAIAPAQQGKGYGAELLKLSCSELVGTVDGPLTVSATIKRSNHRSRRMFQAGGFSVASSGGEFMHLEKVLR